jgi:Secretion system C-terminal sorting domain
MKTICLLAASLFLSLIVKGQIITTVAGNGIVSYTGDGGLASAASIGAAGYLVFDHLGNYYVGELNNTIRKIASSGIITTIAGNGTTGGTGDGGLATNASFSFTGGGGLGIDSKNNIYIADEANHRIRKVDAVTGIVTTVAGTGTAGYSGDGGSATLAQLHSPAIVTFDVVGNMYVSDGFNYRIRKINTAGIISTIAGTGTMGYSGDGSIATSAQIYGSGGMKVGLNNNLYLAEGRIRKIDLNTGIITSIAGNGIPGYSGDGGPATAAEFYGTQDVVQAANGMIYVSDPNAHVIRGINTSGIISTVVGTGANSFVGDGGPATAAEIYSPRGVAVDACNNLYLVDNGNKRIRKVTYNPSCNPVTADVPNVQTEQLFAIYPNPTTNLINIDKPQGKANFRLLSIVGAVQQQGVVDKVHNTVDVNNVANGLYLLELITEDGKRSVSKVVKQ